MLFSNVKDFQKKALLFIRNKEDVIITKYGKPVAKLVPFDENEDMIALQEYFKLGDSISDDLLKNKDEIKNIMKDVKKEIYG